MRQTSEQFANAMLEDIESENPNKSLAEQLAEMEKRIGEKIAETENKIYSKLESVNETTPEGESNDSDEEIEEVEHVENEENEGE